MSNVNRDDILKAAVLDPDVAVRVKDFAMSVIDHAEDLLESSPPRLKVQLVNRMLGILAKSLEVPAQDSSLNDLEAEFRAMLDEVRE